MERVVPFALDCDMDLHRTKDIVLSRGLEGQDLHLDTLTALYEELQLVSIDTNPGEDLISFSHRAVYFGVITKSTADGGPRPLPVPPPVVPWNPPSPRAVAPPSRVQWQDVSDFLHENDDFSASVRRFVDERGDRRSNPHVQPPSLEPNHHSPQESFVYESGENALANTWSSVSLKSNHPDQLLTHCSENGREHLESSKFLSRLQHGRLTIVVDLQPVFQASDGPSDYTRGQRTVSALDLFQFSQPHLSRKKKVSYGRNLKSSMKSSGTVAHPLMECCFCTTGQGPCTCDVTEPLSTGHRSHSSILDAKQPIGIIYLVAQSHDAPHSSMLNIGIVIQDQHREFGHAKHAVGLVLRHAFAELQCHRVQAMLLDTYAKDRALTLFTQT